jgi:hypothetical protein
MDCRGSERLNPGLRRDDDVGDDDVGLRRERMRRDDELRRDDDVELSPLRGRPASGTRRREITCSGVSP